MESLWILCISTTLFKVLSLHLRLFHASLQAILSHMRVECKCHGVSGSCEVKTCWKAMPPFRKVGNIIKEKFDGATEVEQRKVGTTKVLVPRNSQFKPHTDEDLVYLDPSPDFCDYDPRTPGMLGTVGRQCNRTSKAIDGCELMCCGRGFQTQEVEVVDRCSCKFHWCCYVKCKQCRKMVEMHTCRWWESEAQRALLMNKSNAPHSEPKARGGKEDLCSSILSWLKPPHPPLLLNGFRLSGWEVKCSYSFSRLCMGFLTKLQRRFVSSQIESIFHFLSPSLTHICFVINAPYFCNV